MVSEIDILQFLTYDFGYGCGYLNNNGYGDGSGNGCGYAHGSGNGCGYAHGSGNGCGYGYSYDSGENYGIAEINGHKVYVIDTVQTIIYSIHGTYAKGATIQDNTILVDCYVAKYNGYFAHGEILKDAIKSAKEKYEATTPLNDRIDSFVEVYPTLESLGTGREFFSWHHILTGSCEFGRNEFCKTHNVDLNKTYTTEYFLNLVKNSYGREVIEQTMVRYKK